MPITHEDITELKKVFDDRYVLQSDCNERQEEIQKVLADDDKQIALILQEQKQMRKEQKKRVQVQQLADCRYFGGINCWVYWFLFLCVLTKRL